MPQASIGEGILGIPIPYTFITTPVGRGAYEMLRNGIKVEQTVDATRYYVAVLLVVCLLSFEAHSQEKDALSPWVAGTYSNLVYNKEGGDLNGVEIRLIPTRKGVKAVVQFAEGGAGDVALVDATVSGSHIHFLTPSTFDPEGEFDGTVSEKALVGTFKYKGGASEHLVLPRGASYWEKRK
jgi:hypothetical protein